MKNVKLHFLALGLTIVAELIGIKSFKIGVGTMSLLPMLYALIMGILLTPKFLNVAKEKEMSDAGSLIGITLMLLMAKYGTNIGPTLPQIIKASPALILQEFGNLGTALLGITVAVFIGLKREAIGAAHSIAREPNVAIIGERRTRSIRSVYSRDCIWYIIYGIDGKLISCIYSSTSLFFSYGNRGW